MNSPILPYGVCRTLFEHTDAALLVIDDHHRIVAANPAAQLLLGQKEPDGLPARQFICSSSIACFEEVCATLHDDNTHTIEIPDFEFVNANGKPLSVKVRFFIHTHDTGTKWMMIVFRDISADKELKNHFSQVFHSSPVSKSITDSETHRYAEVNDAFCKLAGMQRENIIGKTTEELGFSIRDKNKLIEKLRKNGTVQNIDIEVTRADGTELQLLLSSEILEIAGRKYFLTVQVDVTEQRKAQQKALALNDFLQNVLENTSDGFVSFDRDWQYLYVNPNATILLGKSEAELIGNRIWDIFPSMAGSEFESRLRDAMENRKSVSFDGTRPVNTNVWVHVRAYPIEQGLAVFFTDITEKKKAEQALLATNEELDMRVRERTMELTALLEREKNINEMKSRFVSMASHEFRTPLSALLSSVNLLEFYVKPGPDTRETKHINRIKSSVEHLTNILDDFLSLDKLENGKLEVKATTFDLDEFARELVSGMNELLKPGQDLAYHYTGECHAVLDKHIIKNTLNNLLSNAIKFTPANKNMSLCIQNKDGHVELTVRDNGIGIPTEEQPFVFSRLFRASNAINVSGTGLGLNIVKRYVELLGGRISFTSAPEEGTQFVIVLPFADRESAPVALQA